MTGKTGRIITIAWIAMVAIWVLCNTGRFGEMKAGEYGDFLAGTFAPLAFLWVLIGIQMQREELRLQRDELRLQREELRRTRETQARIASASEAEARDNKRQAQPTFGAASWNGTLFVLEVMGASSDFEIWRDGAPCNWDVNYDGSRLKITFRDEVDGWIELHYRDANNEKSSRHGYRKAHQCRFLAWGEERIVDGDELKRWLSG